MSEIKAKTKTNYYGIFFFFDVRYLKVLRIFEEQCPASSKLSLK